MPLPLKAYTNTVVYGDKGKANRDKMSQMMDGLEESLDNLSYDLKKRFRELVVSQLSLLRYRDKDFDAKSLKINSNESTQRAKKDSQDPLYRKTDTSRIRSIEVMQRRENEILRSNNLLKCNNELGVDECKLSARLKKAVNEMKQIDNVSSTYDKNAINQRKSTRSMTPKTIHRDSGSKHLTRNSIKNAKHGDKLPSIYKRYSHEVDRQQDFLHATANAADMKTNRQQPNFEQSSDISKNYHRHAISCNLTDNDQDKQNHPFPAESQNEIRIQTIQETLDSELEEQRNQVSNGPLHPQSEGMANEKIYVDTDEFDIKSDTNYVTIVTNMADIRRSSNGIHLRKEKIDDIQLSGLSTGKSKLPMELHSTSRPPSMTSNVQGGNLAQNTKNEKKPVSSGHVEEDGRICTNMPITGICRSRPRYMSLKPEETLYKEKDKQLDTSILACIDASKRAEVTMEHEKEHLKEKYLLNKVFDDKSAGQKEQMMISVTPTENLTYEQKINTSQQEKIQDNLLSESTSIIVERLEDDSAYHTFDSISSDQSRNDHPQRNNYPLSTCNQPGISPDETMAVTNETSIVDSRDYINVREVDKLDRWSPGINSMSTPQKTYPNSGEKERELHQRVENLVYNTSGQVGQNINLTFEKSSYQYNDNVKTSSFPLQQTDDENFIELGKSENITEVTDPTLQTFDSISSDKQRFDKGIFVQSPLNDGNTSVPRDCRMHKFSIKKLSEKQIPGANGIRYTVKSKLESPVSFNGQDTIREMFEEEDNVPLKSKFTAGLEQPLINNGFMNPNLASDEKPSADMKIKTKNPSSNDKKENNLMKDVTINDIADLKHCQHVVAQLNDAQKQLDQSIYNMYSDKSPVEVLLSPRIRKMKRLLCDGKENACLEIIDNFEILNANVDSKKEHVDTLFDNSNDLFKQNKICFEKSAHSSRSPFDKQKGGHQEINKQKRGKHFRKSARSECTGNHFKDSERQFEWKLMSRLHQTNEMLFLMENLLTENLHADERNELWNEVHTELLLMTKEISHTLEEKSTYRKQWDSKLREAEKELKKMIDSTGCIEVEDTVTRLKLAATKLGGLDRGQGLLIEQRDMLLRLHSLSKLLQALSHRTLRAIETEDTQTQDNKSTKRVFHPNNALFTVTRAVTWPIRKLRDLARGTSQGSNVECASSMRTADTNIPPASYEVNHTNTGNENIKSIPSTSFEASHTNTSYANNKSARYVDTDGLDISSYGTKSEKTSMAESGSGKERPKQIYNANIGEDTTRLENSHATVAISKEEEDKTRTCVTFTNHISASIGHTHSISVRNIAKHTDKQLPDCSQNSGQSSRRLFLCPEHHIIIVFIFGFILGALFIILGPNFLSFLERKWLTLASYMMCKCKLVHAVSPIV